MFTSLLASNPWPRRWLQLAVLALAISGVFSICLVIARTPQLIVLFPWMREFFSVSLVIHVDLSVLVWFLAMTGLLFSLMPQRAAGLLSPLYDMMHWASYQCVFAAVGCMALSPLTGEWEVIKSNYIPVITNALFFAGLSLLFAGMALAALRVLLACDASSQSEPFARAAQATAITLLLALGCFVAAALGIPSSIAGLAFYEHLFWGGGHILQFVYMQGLLIAWVVLASTIGLVMPANKLLSFCLLVGTVLAWLAIYPFIAHEVMSQEYLDAFSLQMNLALGVGASLLGLWIALQAIQKRQVLPRNAYATALAASCVLFIVGGAFGAAINGPNVRIPAHYHGSIVAVTLALMGLAYWLLPKLGGRDVSAWRSARWQPVLYGVGQLFHISGLAISGGYGVLRKSVGDVGSGGWEVKAALGMMGGGGLLAIIGGLLFVVVMVKGFRRCSV